jgi:hypothetical protein
MIKTPMEIVCPFCKAGVSLPCKSVEGHKMRGVHRQRLTKKEPLKKNEPRNTKLATARKRTLYKLENILWAGHQAGTRTV